MGESALDIQVGGGHYKDLAIQPIEYTHKNNLNFIQGNIIKYTTRYKHKNGVEDLKKVKHYVDLLIEFEYGKLTQELPPSLKSKFSINYTKVMKDKIAKAICTYLSMVPGISASLDKYKNDKFIIIEKRLERSAN